MDIVFLGTSTDEKRFFLLCLAKILSFYKKVVIYSSKPYAFEEDLDQIYDCCGIEIHQFVKEENLTIRMEEETYNFLDLEEFIPLQEGFKTVAICEPSRRILEESVRLAEAFSWIQPSVGISVVYLNLMEYCKASKKYLDLFWERSVPSFTKISEIYPFYFEEANRIVMLESQFSDRLPIKALTPSFKAGLTTIVQGLFNLEAKDTKDLLKKAERMK